MPRILVTYASRYGSTTEVAAAIAEELTASGLDVDVMSARPEIQVAKYDAVVVGAAAYGRKWLPDASVFVVGNQDSLSKLPVALFTVGTLGVKNPKAALREHDRIVATLNELAPGFNPVATALFHGSFTRSNLPLCLRVLDWMAGTPQGDHRDWDAIRGWAQRLGDLLRERLDDSGSEAGGEVEGNDG